jgi:transcriptional regulator with XRE-family HTH domain
VAGRYALSTGIGGLDDALGGLLVGDNVVWAHAPGATDTVDAFEAAFATATVTAGRPLVWVTGQRSPAEVRDRFRAAEVVDARGVGRADVAALADRIVDVAGARSGAGVVCDALGPVAEACGPDAAARLFESACPRLFDEGPVACWRAPRAVLRKAALDRIERITQCVVAVLAGRARIDKADGRPRAVLDTVLRIEPTADGGLQARPAGDAAGVVAAALTRLCQARGLTHTELAELAGVGHTSISEALVGSHSLSLDTILGLCDQLEIGLDEFFATAPRPGYTIGRRDLHQPQTGAVPLLDDDATLVRVELVRLAAREVGSPSTPHARGQLVLVGSGLVKVAVSDGTPVLRAGDALAAPAGITIAEWENLADHPAGLFWASRR